VSLACGVAWRGVAWRGVARRGAARRSAPGSALACSLLNMSDAVSFAHAEIVFQPQENTRSLQAQVCKDLQLESECKAHAMHKLSHCKWSNETSECVYHAPATCPVKCQVFACCYAHTKDHILSRLWGSFRISLSAPLPGTHARARAHAEHMVYVAFFVRVCLCRIRNARICMHIRIRIFTHD